MAYAHTSRPTSGARRANGPDIDLTREPMAADRSLPELLSELTDEAMTLMRQEIALAKLETKEEATKAAKAGGMLGAAALTGYLALLFASFALAWLLSEIMHVALAFLVVAVLYGIAAAVLGVMGRKKFQEVDPVPEETVETLKEDAEWARAQRN